MSDSHRKAPVKVRRGKLNNAAQKVKRAGRYGDDMVIHVNKKEYEDLCRRWGKPTFNPETNMPEFFSADGFLDGLQNIGGYLDTGLDYIGDTASDIAGYFSDDAANFLSDYNTELGGALVGGLVGRLTGGDFLESALYGGLGGHALDSYYGDYGDPYSSTSGSATSVPAEGKGFLEKVAPMALIGMAMSGDSQAPAHVAAPLSERNPNLAAYMGDLPLQNVDMDALQQAAKDEGMTVRAYLATHPDSIDDFYAKNETYDKLYAAKGGAVRYFGLGGGAAGSGGEGNDGGAGPGGSGSGDSGGGGSDGMGAPGTGSGIGGVGSTGSGIGGGLGGNSGNPGGGSSTDGNGNAPGGGPAGSPGGADSTSGNPGGIGGIGGMGGADLGLDSRSHQTADLAGAEAAVNGGMVGGFAGTDAGLAMDNGLMSGIVGKEQGLARGLGYADSLSSAAQAAKGALGTTQGLANTAKATMNAMANPVSTALGFLGINPTNIPGMSLANFATSLAFMPNPIAPLTKAINPTIAKSLYSATKSVPATTLGVLGLDFGLSKGVNMGLDAMTANNSPGVGPSSQGTATGASNAVGAGVGDMGGGGEQPIGALASMVPNKVTTVLNANPTPQEAVQNNIPVPGYSYADLKRMASGQHMGPKQYLAQHMDILPQLRMAEGGYTGDGRDDKIPAMLSDGEYVLDAETVSMLGDGSTAAGTHKLDEMRRNLREHKGQNMAQGRISPEAKSPLAYFKGA